MRKNLESRTVINLEEVRKRMTRKVNAAYTGGNAAIWLYAACEAHQPCEAKLTIDATDACISEHHAVYVVEEYGTA